MNTSSVSAVTRIVAWLLSAVIFGGTLALSGKLARVASHAPLALGVLAGIAVAGELLARLGAQRPPARREEMRALIAPFYATLRRTVRGQEADGDGAPAAGAPAFEFDAATASIMRDEDSAYRNEAGQFVYEIHRYARNPEGEYFWMILAAVDGTPQLAYIKHVEQHIARYALKDRYVAPPPRMA